MSKYFSLIYSGKIRTAPNQKVIPAKAFSELLTAMELLDKTKEDIKIYLERNQEACREILEETKQAGFKEGLLQFNKQILHYQERIKEMEHEFQKQVLPLALMIAKKVLAQELQSNPESIVAIVRQALKPVTQSHHIKIFVSKEDRDILEQKKQELKDIFEHVHTFVIEEKEGIKPGDCMIETEAGIINASLENQWNAIEAAFHTFMKK